MTDSADDLISRPQAREAGVGPLLLNQNVFDETAAFLENDAIVHYLHMIADRGAVLQVKLQMWDAPGVAAEVAEEAHTLAGSSGMFGLERLATAARILEHAIQVSEPSATSLASDLEAAISETNDMITCLVGALGRSTSKLDTSEHNFELVRKMEIPT